MSAAVSIISPQLPMRASILLCSGLLLASPAIAAVTLSSKHLIVLRAGTDSVWGDYIFSVQNRAADPQRAEIVLFLPKETVDFKAIEGVTAADLRVDAARGAVLLQKDFPPGASLVNIGFKVTAEAGTADLNWRAAQPLESVNIMYEHEIVEVIADNRLAEALLPRISEVKYRALRTTAALATGDALSLKVTAVPRGRTQLHVFAVVFALILLLSTVYLGIVTRPRKEEST